MADKQSPKPPRHLKAPTKRWWKSVVDGYALEPHHVRLLTLAVEACDRCQQSREALQEHGLTYIHGSLRTAQVTPGGSHRERQPEASYTQGPQLPRNRTDSPPRLRGSPWLIPCSQPGDMDYLVILQLGNAFCRSAMPASVTLVPNSPTGETNWR